MSNHDRTHSAKNLCSPIAVAVKAAFERIIFARRTAPASPKGPPD
jgi:hypothetical protein